MLAVWGMVPHPMHKDVHYMPECCLAWTESCRELLGRIDLRSCLLACDRGVRKRKTHTRCCLEKSQHQLPTLTNRGCRLGKEGAVDLDDTEYGRFAYWFCGFKTIGQIWASSENLVWVGCLTKRVSKKTVSKIERIDCGISRSVADWQRFSQLI